jgi:hypothetical protein
MLSFNFFKCNIITYICQLIYFKISKGGYRHRFGTAALISICQGIKKGSDETPQNPYIYYISIDYSITVATLPEPTVLPPSRVYALIFYIPNPNKICISVPILI